MIVQALRSAWGRTHFSITVYPGSQGHFSSFRRLLLQINVLESLAKPLIHFPLLLVINLSSDDNVVPIRDLKCLGKESNRHDAATMSLLAEGLLWDSSSNYNLELRYPTLVNIPVLGTGSYFHTECKGKKKSLQ